MRKAQWGKIHTIMFFLFIFIGCSGPGPGFEPDPFADKTKLVVVSNINGDFRTLEDALSRGMRNIFLRNGNYYTSNTIVVNTSNVTIEGESKNGVRIIQRNPQNDLLYIRANGVVIRNLTLDTRTYDAQAALVEAGASDLLIENNNIYGGSKTFSVFFAGPPVSPYNGTNFRDETMNVYLENGQSRFDFSRNNVIKNNNITSNFLGDGVSFSIQKNGVFEGNVLDGAMLAVYMDKDCVITRNTIQNSLQHGIYLTLPSEKIEITQNSIIRPQFNGIVVKPQYAEHGYQGENILSSEIVLSDNLINANINGLNIEGYDSSHLSWGRFDGLEVKNNMINQFDFSGIWMFNLSTAFIHGNKINFQNCTMATRGLDIDGDGVADIPAIASRDSAGISLYDNLVEITILENSITKNSRCQDVSILQNAITLSSSSITNPSIDSVRISGNIFTNTVSDWLHSAENHLRDFVFVNQGGGNDYSAYNPVDFAGIDVQNLSVLDEVTTENNQNAVTP